MARRAARRSPRVPHALYTPRCNLVRTLRLSGHATVLFPRLSASSEVPETSCLHTMQIVNFRFHLPSISLRQALLSPPLSLSGRSARCRILPSYAPSPPWVGYDYTSFCFYLEIPCVPVSPLPYVMSRVLPPVHVDYGCSCVLCLSLIPIMSCMEKDGR